MKASDIISLIRIRTPKAEGVHHVDRSFSRLMERISAYESTQRLQHLNSVYKWWAAAASVALLIIAGMQLLKEDAKETRYIVQTNVSSIVKRITLPDGSLVAVNAGSKLIYPEEFTSKKREVFLTGEAYFEVAHNKEKPFIVRVGDLDVKVLGTKFNVKAYSNETNITTTLLEGAVMVENSATNQSQRLSPNEILTYNQISHKTTVIKTSEAENNVLWLNEIIEMNQMKLEDLCKSLEQVYHVKFLILNEALKSKRFTGEFRYGEDLDSFLEALKITTPFSYKVVNHTYILK